MEDSVSRGIATLFAFVLVFLLGYFSKFGGVKKQGDVRIYRYNSAAQVLGWVGLIFFTVIAVMMMFQKADVQGAWIFGLVVFFLGFSGFIGMCTTRLIVANDGIEKRMFFFRKQLQFKQMTKMIRVVGPGEFLRVVGKTKEKRRKTSIDIDSFFVDYFSLSREIKKSAKKANRKVKFLRKKLGKTTRDSA